MSICWSGALLSGNPIIDFQHKLALEMIRKLMVDFKNGGQKYTLDEAIVFFDCYVLEHFSDEEEIISRHKLPGLEKHVREHKMMVKRLALFKEKVAKQRYSRSLIAELLAETSGFLISHFKKSDRSMIISLKKIYSPANKSQSNILVLS